MLATIRRTAFMIIIFTILFSAVAGAGSSGKVAEDSWTTKAPMHEARIGLGAAAVNGKIYAIGGNTGHSISAINEEYDPATDTWTYKTPMPTPRLFFGIAVYQNKIYCIGGTPSGSSYDPIGWSTGVNEVYNPATDTGKPFSLCLHPE